MENREGRKLIESKRDMCERKNGNGVDPNRNWEVDWGVREADYTPYEEYAGTHPFSEPEPYILREIAEEFKPHVWVNMHSGMEGLFMPYDHVAKIPEAPTSLDTLRILNDLNKEACGSRCTVGSGGKSVGYLAHGTATDYMYEKANVSIAMTWEIYGDSTAKYDECFKMFNPMTESGYNHAVTTWTNAIFQMFVHLKTHPDVAHLVDLGIRSPSDIDTQMWNRTTTGRPDQSLFLRSVAGIVIFAIGLWLIGRKALGKKSRRRKIAVT